MATLYLETNFLISIAMGQDSEAAQLLSSPPRGLHLVLPTVCCIEALSAFARKRSERDEFRQQLDRQIKLVKRDETWEHAPQLVKQLEELGIENEKLANEVQRRLELALEQVAGVVELIPLSNDVLRTSLETTHIDEPTDNLILHVILRHAQDHPTTPMAFLTADSRDFGTPDVREKLQQVGISKHFQSGSAVVGWWQSVSTPQD